MSTPLARPSYAAVLRVPRARTTFAAALAGRLAYGVVSLSLLLATVRATGSYAVAGTVMALFGTSAVLLMPLRASLVDRHGPRRALTPMALLHAGLLSLLAAVTWSPGTPAVVLGAVAALTGACAPPLGPTMRMVWGELVHDRRLLQRAYSLDGVAEELLYVSGPVLVGVLVRFAPPAAGLLLTAALIAAGTCAFVASPVVGALRGSSRRPRQRGKDSAPGLLQPVVVAAGAGLALSAVDLLVTAFAERHGHGADTAAWMLAALSAGSAVGGLLNGAIDWRTPARVRLPWQAAGLGLALCAAGAASEPWSLTAALACAGAFVAPALTTAYLIADETAPPGARTRAGAWINTAVNAGSSCGAISAGLLLTHAPLGACFAAAGATALISAAGAVRATAGRGRTPRVRPRSHRV
ncbi:MFS transporter [Streptomyces griseus]|uniref:MFS transporter n=1 Tax=Streptomyces griseus TaxID=1911 RepID=UPI0005675288|nr:MFS transporter [Streptomyces griseus]